MRRAVACRSGRGGGRPDRDRSPAEDAEERDEERDEGRDGRPAAAGAALGAALEELLDAVLPQGAGDARDALWMGVSVVALVSFSMQLYRLYAYLYFDVLQLQTLREMLAVPGTLGGWWLP